MTVFKNQADEDAWFCRSRWHRYNHRPMSPQNMTDLLNLLHTSGADAVEAFLSDNPVEGAKLESGERALYAKNGPS